MALETQKHFTRCCCLQFTSAENLCILLCCTDHTKYDTSGACAGQGGCRPHKKMGKKHRADTLLGKPLPGSTVQVVTLTCCSPCCFPVRFRMDSNSYTINLNKTVSYVIRVNEFLFTVQEKLNVHIYGEKLLSRFQVCRNRVYRKQPPFIYHLKNTKNQKGFGF